MCWENKMGVTTLTEEQAKIRAIGEKHNDLVRAQFKKEEKLKRKLKLKRMIKKWALIIGISIIIILLGFLVFVSW
jgi:type II restriction/modification system DNA methylase subunit YeeA